MSNEKSPVALTTFITSLFHNLPKLLLTNLLFAVPSAVFFGLFWFINTATGLNSNFILFLTVIPLFPFYAGVVQVTSHMVREDENVDVVHNFISGIKENFLRFLVHGAILYAAMFFSYYSITMYASFGKFNGMFYILLAISIIVSIFFLFSFYYIPPMTVTFDISMKNIYKNGALMTFGEFKHNIIATLGLFVLFLICATVLMCCYVPIAVIIATIILALFLVPSVMSFIINSSVYKPMYKTIVGGNEKSKEIDKKIENRKNGIFDDNEETSQKNIAEGFSNIEVDENADGDEYIYYNGKMIKRSVLLKIKNDENSKGVQD